MASGMILPLFLIKPKSPSRGMRRPWITCHQSYRLIDHPGAVIQQLPHISPYTSSILLKIQPQTEVIPLLPGDTAHPREGGNSGVKALGSNSVVRCNKIFYDIFTILCNGISSPQKKTLCKSKMQLSGADTTGRIFSLFLPSLPFSHCPQCSQEPLLPALRLSLASSELPSTSAPVLCACHILPQ